MIMIKKKLISRVFICIIVLIMTLSFISPSLTAFDSAINSEYAKIKYSAGIDLREHLANGLPSLPSSDPDSKYFFTESGNRFSVSGDNFYKWFMGTREVKEGEEWKVYELVLNYLYAGNTQNINPETSFLVVEPVIKLCDVDSNFRTTIGPRIASWYGYITYNINQGHDPGGASTVRNRLQKIGGGFRLDETGTSGSARGKILEVLGLNLATTTLYTCNGGVTEWFGDSHRL